MAQVIVPTLGQTNLDVKIEKWFKKVGDTVKEGEPLYELSSEKLTQEIESPVSGTLTKIYVNEGDTAANGDLLADID
jgi:pyruvate/2-oxoglutarate dehydrogenase complex dihydrolipoamide acyltransferase (E2) component